MHRNKQRKNIDMRRRISCILFAALLGTAVNAQMEINTVKDAQCFTIMDESQQAVIVYDEADAPVVGTVAECVAGDVYAITGRSLSVAQSVSAGTCPIIAGTIGQSPLVDRLIAGVLIAFLRQYLSMFHDRRWLSRSYVGAMLSNISST